MEYATDDLMTVHPLNDDPHGKPSSEEEYGTKHPNRFEPTQRTLSSTQPQQRIRAQIARLADLAIVSGTPTAITFDTKSNDTQTFDTSGIWSGTKLTIPSTGKITGTWQIVGSVYWAGDAAGTFRQMQIRKGGGTNLAVSQFSPVANPQTQLAQVLQNDPKPGDFYELFVFHDAGHPVNILGGGGVCQIFFNMIHLW